MSSLPIEAMAPFFIGAGKRCAISNHVGADAQRFGVVERIFGVVDRGRQRDVLYRLFNTVSAIRVTSNWTRHIHQAGWAYLQTGLSVEHRISSKSSKAVILDPWPVYPFGPRRLNRYAVAQSFGVVERIFGVVDCGRQRRYRFERVLALSSTSKWVELSRVSWGTAYQVSATLLLVMATSVIRPWTALGMSYRINVSWLFSFKAISWNEAVASNRRRLCTSPAARRMHHRHRSSPAPTGAQFASAAVLWIRVVVVGWSKI